MGNYFTEGLILRHINFREADRLISIYTKDRGLVNVVAKGSRKITSKLAGSLEPFTIAKFMIVKGKNYDTIASSDVLNIFKSIKKDLLKIKLASFFSKIFLSTAREMQKDKNIYEFLLNIFTYLENLTNKKNNEINWLIWYYIWQYLKLSGYQPELYKCQLCKKILKPEKLYFKYKRGGLICGDCNKDAGDQPITPNLIKIIRFILKNGLEDQMKIKISDKLASELILHTKRYYTFVFEADIDIPFFKSA